MAAEDTERSDEAVQKTIWGYAGKVTLWFALILFGLALERLGLTSNILSEMLPGEVQTLRANLAETESKVLKVRNERDDLKMQIDYIADAQGRLDQCLDEVKRIEANLQDRPAAEVPPSR